MPMIDIVRYTPSRQHEWNTFVAEAINATFLFRRQYMDYHAQRFADHSLMAYDKGRLLALLPAHEDGERLCSHNGLTFGGLLTAARTTTAEVMEAFTQIAAYMASHGFTTLVYKPAPTIYQQLPAQADLYALSQIGTLHLAARDAGSAIDLANPIGFSTLRRRKVAKAIRNGLRCEESRDLEAFWHILEHNLAQRFGAKPVHSLDEMRLLSSRFPNEIRLMATFRDSEMVAGVLLYHTQQVVRTQYISASPEGKATGALDLLFHHLTTELPLSQRYLDLGTSALAGSHAVNPGLLFQKEGFGARTVCFDKYEWQPTGLSSHEPVNSKPINQLEK